MIDPENANSPGAGNTEAALEALGEGAAKHDNPQTHVPAGGGACDRLFRLSTGAPTVDGLSDVDDAFEAEVDYHLKAIVAKKEASLSAAGSSADTEEFDFDDTSEYIEGPDLSRCDSWPSWPGPFNPQQRYNRALMSWHYDRNAGITRRWEELAKDLLVGRLDAIPADEVTRIEDLLTQRIQHFYPYVSSFLAACWWAQHGMRVFPQLPTKVPLIRSPHPTGSAERVTCKRACGQDGHGHLDATTDLDRIRSWARKHGFGWGGIAGRLPEGLIDIEDDPRHGGDVYIRQLQDTYGPLPKTLEIISGRGDGGRHRIFSVPTGLPLSGRRLRGTGVDLKDHNGAVRLPPSTHHVNFQPYLLVSRPVAPAPAWLLALLLAEPKHNDSSVACAAGRRESIADRYCATASWNDLLTAHNWLCVAGDGDSDGSRWRHPDATSESSASIAHGCLFVFSPNTDFAATDSGDAHGYTKFRAYALLEHGGDMKAAAQVLLHEMRAGIR